MMELFSSAGPRGAGGEAMTFVQLIECRTSRLDEMNRLMDRWVEQTKGKRTASHSVVAKDRADASHVVEIVEFPSYEEAMRNSGLPETGRIFQEMVALCDETPTFTDLDVVRDEQLYAATARRFFEQTPGQGAAPPFNDVFIEDYHDHDPANVQDVIGLDAVRREVEVWRGGFDFSFTSRTRWPRVTGCAPGGPSTAGTRATSSGFRRPGRTSP
ncbi:hypothetical protein GCM10010304_31290 [Streptomyces roseoviolaceus]